MIASISRKSARTCHRVLSINDFEKNQRAPKSKMRSRRSSCKNCRKSKKGVSSKARKEFEEKHPRPPIGDTFECPLCNRMFTVYEKSINLDHDSTTGEIRGWICADCNTGMGKLQDSVPVLAKAILLANSLFEINRFVTYRKHSISFSLKNYFIALYLVT